MLFALACAKASVGRRGAAATLLAAWIVCGCGGGGSGSGSPAPTGDAATPVMTTKSVAISIDASLTGGTALAFPRVTTITDRQPVGMPLSVSAKGEHAVFALDSAGNIALAGTIPGDATSVTLSAESTVLALGVITLGTLVPDALPDQLRVTLRAAKGFDELVSSVGQAVREGKNPLDQSNIQTGFDTVFSAASVAAKPQSARVHPLAVARDRLEYGDEPVILNTATFQVSLANSSVKESTLASKIYLRNTSALTFTAGLVDLSGAQRASEPLEGAGATAVSLPTTVFLNKSFDGSFSIRLQANDAVNANNVLKAAIELVVKAPGVSLSSQCTTAISKATLNFVVDVSFPKDPDTYVLKAAVKLFSDAANNLLTDCAYLKPDPTDLVALLATVKKIAKFVGFVRIVTDQKLLPAPLPDTGVCVTEGQYLMSCVSQITVDAIKPMMPNAVQPINVLMLDATGKKTSSPPYGLKIEYSNPGLFELSSTMTSVNANLNNVEGIGTFKITDPATDKTFSMSVTITNGKPEKTAYTVPRNGTVDVRLVDPASGSEVYRSGVFDIYVADGSFGSFTPKTRGLGPLTFHASGVATPTPQPIRLNGARDSGSTMAVEGASSYWRIRYQIGSDDLSSRRGIGFVGVLPSRQHGTTFGSVAGYISFRSGQPVLIVGSGMSAAIEEVRSVLPDSWNATDNEFRFTINTQDYKRETVLTVTDRTSTTMSGTVRLDTFSSDEAGLFPSVGTGTWRAELQIAAFPAVDMKDFEYCDAVNTGLYSVHKGYFSGWGPQVRNACVFGDRPFSP